jgi:hypothetical protein
MDPHHSWHDRWLAAAGRVASQVHYLLAPTSGAAR